MTAAEFVRDAAESLALGELVSRSDPIPPDTVAQIERIYRGVYLLATLKHDEMIGEGRQDDDRNHGGRPGVSGFRPGLCSNPVAVPLP